jgi:hypothetical protein
MDRGSAINRSIMYSVRVYIPVVILYRMLPAKECVPGFLVLAIVFRNCSLNPSAFRDDLQMDARRLRPSGLGHCGAYA